MSIDNIQERAENIETTQQLSDIFVDPNILNRLTQNKNQIVYGRRGTGKTHLLGRMREYYRDTFAENRILPIYINASRIAIDVANAEANPGLAILIEYKAFLESVISGIEQFIEENEKEEGILKRVWPKTKFKAKKKNVGIALGYIRKLIKEGGKVEIGPGRVTRETSEGRTATKGTRLVPDFR